MLKVLSSPQSRPEIPASFSAVHFDWELSRELRADGQLPLRSQCDQKWIFVSVRFLFLFSFSFFVFSDLVGVVNTARLSISVCCQLARPGMGVEGSQGCRRWASLPRASNHSSLAGSKGLSFSVFRFSAFRSVICWVGVLLIPTILFWNFQWNAGTGLNMQSL